MKAYLFAKLLRFRLESQFNSKYNLFVLDFKDESGMEYLCLWLMILIYESVTRQLLQRSFLIALFAQLFSYLESTQAVLLMGADDFILKKKKKRTKDPRHPLHDRYPCTAVLVFRPLLKDDKAMVNKVFNVDSHFSAWHFFQRARLKRSTTIISTYVPHSPCLCHFHCYLRFSHPPITQP